MGTLARITQIPYNLAVFVDLKKAFDTVDFSILINKLEHYGFRGKSNIWFQNYLTNRKQYVCYNDHNSDLSTITCGVPQGSVLGPLLFILYINDLPNCSNFTKLLFADDTTLQLSGNSISELERTAKLELTKVSDWFRANLLTLNIKKTKYILFSPPKKSSVAQNFSLFIDDVEIDRVGERSSEKSFKFVGFHIDESLSWKYHLNQVMRNLSYANYTIARLKNFLPMSIRKTLYTSLFQTHIDYSIIAIGALPKYKLKPLINIQKKCLRNVANVDQFHGSNILLHKFSVLKLDDLFRSACNKFVYKFHRNQLPRSFDSFLIPMGSYNRTNSFITKKTKSKFLEQFPTHFLPQMWNCNNLEIKLAPNLRSVRKIHFNTCMKNYSKND